MFEVVLYNFSRCEIDRKRGESFEEILREYAKEWCMSGGDELHFIDYSDD